MKTTLSEKEFAQAVNLSRTTLWRLREKGQLPHIRIGRRILFTQEHIDQFLARFERGGDVSAAGN